MTGFDTYFIAKSGTMEALNNIEDGMKILNSETSGYLWLDYYRPTEENMSILLDLFDIHVLSVEDCLDDDQVPKINEYENYIHILFNTFSYTGKVLHIGEINLFAGNNFLISVEKNNRNLESDAKAYREIVRAEISNAKLGPAYALHIILDHIVDDKFNAIEGVSDELARLEDIMTDSHKDFDHSLLQKIRHSLLDLRKSLFHEREILVKICRNDIDLIPDKAIIHYNDIYDHISKFFELTEIYREMVTSLIQTNLAIINNDISKAANNTNLSVKRLTVITTIFMPLTFLAGIFGMSEWTMITGSDNWKYSYPAFFCIMLVIAVANYFVIKWLERRK